MQNLFEDEAARLSPRSGALFHDLGRGRFRVTGLLLAAKAPALFVHGKRSFAGHARVEVDLQDVERIDSAGLTVLLEWVAWSNAQHITLTYRNIPEQLTTLATVWEVDSLLPSG